MRPVWESNPPFAPTNHTFSECRATAAHTGLVVRRSYSLRAHYFKNSLLVLGGGPRKFSGLEELMAAVMAELAVAMREVVTARALLVQRLIRV